MSYLTACKKTFAVAATAAAALWLALLLPAAGCGSSGNGDGEEASGTPIEAGLPAIELLVPGTSGAGEVPGFEWAPVDGAARYRLVVLDGSGKMLWAWNGADTKVNLGGLPEARPEGVGGPLINAGSSWSVIAFDASGNAIAASNIRAVSP